MKNLLFSVLTFLSISNFATGTEQKSLERCESYEIPKNFDLKEKWFSLTTSYKVYTKEGERIGKVSAKFLSLTTSFNYKNRDHELLAHAKARFFSWGTTVDVLDGEDRLVGIVKQKIFTFLPKFEIYDQYERHVATAKSNFWGNKYRVESRLTGAKIAEIKRPWYYHIQFKNTWKIRSHHNEMLFEEDLDSRLLMMTAVYRIYIEKMNSAFDQTLRMNREMTNNIALTSLTYDPLDHELHSLVNEFRAIKTLSGLDGCDPSEEELENAADLLTPYFNEEDLPEDMEDDIEISAEEMIATFQYKQKEFLKATLEKSIDLLNGDELSPEQKKSLILLLDQRLNNK